MTITKNLNGSKATLLVEGRLDTLTAPELEKEIQSVSQAEELVIDFSHLEYISSAGLRVLLATHKEFVKKGGLSVTNASDSILDIFDITGFKDILDIK